MHNDNTVIFTPLGRDPRKGLVTLGLGGVILLGACLHLYPLGAQLYDCGNARAGVAP